MPAETAIQFFLQLTVILVACRVAGLAAQRIGQPQVVGEMIAGVILGPSLLGRVSPGLQDTLFPDGVANVVLYTTAQIGLVLYMFIIGLNFDINHVKNVRAPPPPCPRRARSPRSRWAPSPPSRCCRAADSSAPTSASAWP